VILWEQSWVFAHMQMYEGETLHGKYTIVSTGLKRSVRTVVELGVDVNCKLVLLVCVV
jgi:hypothetical protein